MKKVLVFFVKGFEEIEALFPVDLMRRAGIEVTMASLEQNKEIKGSHGIEVKVDKSIEEINYMNYDAIVFPGGPGYLEYFNYSILKDILNYYVKENKLISAICAAPIFLFENGILNNKKATCFYNDKFDNKVEYLDENVVVFENIITARSISSAEEFGLEIVKYLLGEQSYINLKNQIKY